MFVSKINAKDFVCIFRMYFHSCIVCILFPTKPVFVLAKNIRKMAKNSWQRVMCLTIYVLCILFFSVRTLSKFYEYPDFPLCIVHLLVHDSGIRQYLKTG